MPNKKIGCFFRIEENLKMKLDIKLINEKISFQDFLTKIIKKYVEGKDGNKCD